MACIKEGIVTPTDQDWTIFNYYYYREIELKLNSYDTDPTGCQLSYTCESIGLNPSTTRDICDSWSTNTEISDGGWFRFNSYDTIAYPPGTYRFDIKGTM